MLAALLLLSCVPRGSHEVVQVQLDATRMALSARDLACFEEGRDKDTKIELLSSTVQQADERCSSLEEQLAAQADELATVRGHLATLSTRVPATPEEEVEDPELDVVVEAVSAAMAREAQARREAAQEQAIMARWQDLFDVPPLAGRVELVDDGGRVMLRIPSAQIFNEGRVTVSPRGSQLLDQLAHSLSADGPVDLEIVAHTDDRPHHSAEHASNWELTYAQARLVMRVLQEKGVEGRVVVGAAAANFSRADNSTAEGRASNQRVEIRIHRAPAR